MNQYLMIFRQQQNTAGNAANEEQMKAAVQQWQTWIAGIAAQGNLVGTNRLLPEGKTLRADNITDGPYVEGKEVIGGYLLIKANSLNDAVEMAKGCPGLKMNAVVEVRSVMYMEQNATAKNFLEQKA